MNIVNGMRFLRGARFRELNGDDTPNRSRLSVSYASTKLGTDAKLQISVSKLSGGGDDSANRAKVEPPGGSTFNGQKEQVQTGSTYLSRDLRLPSTRRSEELVINFVLSPISALRARAV